MFGKSIKLFKLFGFTVKADLSWLIIAFLVTWSLAAGLFPFRYKGFSAGTYWTMGVIGALGLFFSIVFHEMVHSLVARRFGLPMKGITLFIFGGVAEMSEEPQSAKAEFSMAIAGPLSSIFLALFFYAVYFLGVGANWPMYVNGIFNYLGLINGILAAFNLVPAFPLDGGRVLRAGLWSWKKNIRWATRTSAKIGSGFGLVLIILGVLSLLAGNLIGGIWWFLIGMFLRNAANMSYQQLMTRQALEGEPVRRFMQPHPITVTPETSIDDLVENYIYRYHYKMFPVVEDSTIVGCITTKEVKEIPREEWARHQVSEYVHTCSPQNTIGPNEDSMKALSTMNRTGSSRLIVVEDGKLIGVISLKDLMRFLSLKIELNDEGNQI
ncbi:MAG: CBS domain-containing protein [Candidatus Abyssobacteria bacterium SURF_5]|uniref:Zinc metalloprotease n=1 Tax=Abyssobacteria bacterium (strain SURF_5) TaxID=2093360 RepID=A0A3A4N639_ABYX5|nr:MAG: CBS domain-containing protein [Candidatus Abyssubacteria bacterium SURF_5]